MIWMRKKLTAPLRFRWKNIALLLLSLEALATITHSVEIEAAVLKS